MKGTDSQSFTEMIHNQHSLQDLCNSQWRFFVAVSYLWICFTINHSPCVLYLHGLSSLPLKRESKRETTAANSLLYNCRSLLRLPWPKELFTGLLRPFVPSKILLLPSTCSVKVQAYQERRENNGGHLGLAPTWALVLAKKLQDCESWSRCCPAPHLYWHPI